jgi:hypothetical protein
MLLVRNKQPYKEITKNRKTQQDRQNTQKRTAEKNKDIEKDCPNSQQLMQSNCPET